MSYELLMPFDTDDDEFVRGFEAGCVYACLARFTGGDVDFEATVHASNAEMMLRIAERHGVRATSTELGVGWISVRFTQEDDCQATWE